MQHSATVINAIRLHAILLPAATHKPTALPSGVHDIRKAVLEGLRRIESPSQLLDNIFLCRQSRYFCFYKQCVPSIQAAAATTAKQKGYYSSEPQQSEGQEALNYFSKLALLYSWGEPQGG